MNMNNDSGVINLKDLRKKADAQKMLEAEHPPVVLRAATSAQTSPTVVLKPVAQAPAPVPAPVAMTAPAPVVTQVPAPEPTPRRMYTPEPRRSLSRLQLVIYGASALALVAVLSMGGYYIYEHVWTVSPFAPTPTTASDASSAAAAAATPAPAPTDQSASATSTATSTLSQADIIDRVGKLMLLPQGETPVLAAVSDPNALSSQAFFKNAKIGDVVLMYGQARRAILYDPAADKVIEVAPITDSPVK
jgi:hypothetical protein